MMFCQNVVQELHKNKAKVVTDTFDGITIADDEPSAKTKAPQLLYGVNDAPPWIYCIFLSFQVTFPVIVQWQELFFNAIDYGIKYLSGRLNTS